MLNLRLVAMPMKLSAFLPEVYTTYDSCFVHSDHIEGEAIIAERNAHVYDDGVLDKDEKKALDAAHKKQLHNRHRGVAQYRPYRTAIWMKEGIKKRVLPKKKSSKREREFSRFSLF
jgi:hypothetical protein